MLQPVLHSSLKKQLENLNLKIDDPNYASLLKVISASYKKYDEDLLNIANVYQQDSKELVAANKKLVFERDHTKTKLENIVANVEGVIFETDLNGCFTFLNQAWKTYTGYDLDRSIGKSYRCFLTFNNMQDNNEFHELFARKKKHVKFIFKYQKNKKYMWFEVKAKLNYCSKGIPCGFIGTIIDVTNLKNTELELNKASKAKDEFLSTMSHEIRTPLNAVTGLSNILLMEDYLPEQAENLKALKYSGEHLLGLINDLLDFNKIKSGKLRIAEKDFSLKHFLENINSHFKLRTKEKGLRFNLVKQRDVPTNVIGDQLKLAQVVKNLLSNSLKFTEKGSVSLFVTNLGVDENKVKLEFKVVDTGIGISKNNQHAIFESFMQAKTETSIKYGGTGLGLSISKKLLELQNSSLKVESDSGKGATFTFVIDYKVSNRLNLYEPEMVKMQPDYNPLNIKVLVAEDNKMNVLILKRFFMKWQVTFDVAENGREVLGHLEKADYDIILMDLQMPILDGYQTTKIIRNLTTPKSKIPIVALTAFAQTDIKEKTVHYKMNDFLGKPFDPTKLYNILKSYGKAGNAYNKKLA